MSFPLRFLKGLSGLALPGGRAFSVAGIRTKLAVLFSLTAFFAILTIGLYGYYNASTAYRERAEQLLESDRDQAVKNIDEFLATQRNNLNFLNNFYAILRFAYWHDLNDEGKMEEWRTVAADTLRNVAESYPYYYKIRLIDKNGQEIINVQTDHASGKARYLPDQELQSDAGRDYVTETLKLRQGELFVSALDFNTEHNQIEKPYLPVVRFAQPLIGENQVIYGVTVSNVRAQAIYDYLRTANNNQQGRTFYLIDSDGNYLFHPDAEKQFGHLTGSGYNFDREHHNLLAEMRGKEVGMLTRGGHIHVYRTLYPNPKLRGKPWILVGVEDESVALTELNTFIVVFIALLVLLVALVLYSIRYMTRQLMAPLQLVTLQLEHLGRGEAEPSSLEYHADDEIRQMLDSTERVVSNMDALARQADLIAGGDLSGQVVPLSENDRLSNALNNMTRQLAENHRTDLRRNWLKDGAAQLSSRLSGDMPPLDLADRAVGCLGRYLEAGRGVCYVYNKDEAVLKLLGSYMYTERSDLSNCFKLGSGAVGQCALEMKPIALTVNGASTEAPITTGTTRTTPLHTYTFPLASEKDLLGVIELASFTIFDELKQEFLANAARIIADFLYTALQRERIRLLLGKSEAAECEARQRASQLTLNNVQLEEQQQQLQQQTVELQAANSQLEEQQQQLQQQTIELQAANSQMEEQQQQLQQQTAELQAANSQMEEQQQLLEQRNRDLLHSQQELDTRAKQVEIASQYKSEFLANMSHELRTPLNSIILLSKMMASNEDHKLEGVEVKRAEVIHHAGQELLRLINDVLDLSKVEAGHMELHSRIIESSELAEEFCDLYAEQARDKGLAFNVEDEIRSTLVADRDKLAQIVRNLLSNALKFTRQGSVTLRFWHRANEALPLCISVSDTGIGVAVDKQALIFEAFQQADGSTSREYGGTGLGLSISLSFARLMGGTIELVSTPGMGSTFTLLLPAILPTPLFSDKAVVPVASLLSWPVDDREHIGENDQLLLLIDDDPIFAQAILDINRRLGYLTLLARNGSEGLELARRLHPNGILLDLGLPDMDGAKVLHQLKSTPDLSAIPVYIISARDRDDALLKQGAVGYLHKPVDSEQIATAVAAVLNTQTTDILLIENGTLSEAEIAPLSGNGQMVTLAAATFGGEQLKQAAGRFRLVIIDLGATACSFSAAREIAAQLCQLTPGLSLIFCGKQELSAEDDASLRPYSDSIIIKNTAASRRLQESIAHFLSEAPRRTHGRAALPVPPGSGSKRLVGRHILVVDDDPRNLFVITAALEQHGARVDNALNGRRALELLATLTPDLVIMDIMMPEMDGYKTIEMMRLDARLTAVPVIALTAKAMASDRAKALEAGADDYLAKPSDYQMLINMAAAWCEGRR